MTRSHQASNVSWRHSHCSLLLLPAVLLLRGPVGAQQPAQNDGDAARVLALETLWNQAEVDKDAQALDHLLADNFFYVDIDGSLQTRAQFLESVKHPPEHIVTIGNDSMIAKAYQSTVVVSGTYLEKGTLNGKLYSHRGRFTDTWVKQGASWYCAASQATLIQK